MLLTTGKADPVAGGWQWGGVGAYGAATKIYDPVWEAALAVWGRMRRKRIRPHTFVCDYPEYTN